MTETASHLLELVDLTRQFVRRGTPFDAVSHVDLTIDAGNSSPSSVAQVTVKAP